MFLSLFVQNYIEKKMSARSAVIISTYILSRFVDFTIIGLTSDMKLHLILLWMRIVCLAHILIPIWLFLDFEYNFRHHMLDDTFAYSAITTYQTVSCIFTSFTILLWFMDYSVLRNFLLILSISKAIENYVICKMYLQSEFF